jgi:hypothetical protein
MKLSVTGIGKKLKVIHENLFFISQQVIILDFIDCFIP